ncbi:acyl carrier protein [Streptomyces netropsis]|uniref:acyl carrier protein n=1 Tax=Streptomyces netropsis TaxID=55404 RepID=UPI0037B0B114
MSDTLSRDVIDAFVTDTLVAFGIERGRITVESSFDELGVDSLDVVELSQSLQKELGVPVRPKDFDENQTVGQVLEYVYRAAGLR